MANPNIRAVYNLKIWRKADLFSFGGETYNIGFSTQFQGKIAIFMPELDNKTPSEIELFFRNKMDGIIQDNFEKLKSKSWFFELFLTFAEFGGDLEFMELEILDSQNRWGGLESAEEISKYQIIK